MALPRGPYATNSAVALYVGFRASFSALPGSVGDYFAHFNATGARGRLFANTANAAPQKFRLGVANGANTVSEQFATDLSLNTVYHVIIRYQPATALTTLWIDPSSENDTHTNATDVISASAISTFAFREDPGIGTFIVDDLRIGLTFASVVAPVSPALRVERLGNAIRLAWPRNVGAFTLQSNGDLGSTNWHDVMDAPAVLGGETVLTNSSVTGSLFFRLRK